MSVDSSNRNEIQSDTPTFFRRENLAASVYSAVAQPINTVPMAPLVDTGANGHFFSQEHIAAYLQLHPEGAAGHEPVRVEFPNGQTVESCAEGALHLFGGALTAEAQHTNVFSALKRSMLSVPQLVDGTAVFTAAHCDILDAQQRLIVRCPRHVASGFWVLPDPAAAQPPESWAACRAAQLAAHDQLPANLQAGNVTYLPTVAAQVGWAHASYGSPPHASMVQALQRGYIEVPGITAEQYRKYQRPSAAMSQGHLDMQRQKHQRIPGPRQPNQVHWRLEKVRADADPTGQFPVIAIDGERYMLVAVHLDTGYIHVVPLISRDAAALTAAYEEMLDFFKQRMHAVEMVRLDQECPPLLQQAFRLAFVNHQRAPAGNHRTNSAERAIRSWKNHFIASLCTMDRLCPLQLWALMVRQCELTLNLIRPSYRNKSISAWQELHRTRYPFHSQPFGPVGCKVFIHLRSLERASWSPHAEEGFYLGPLANAHRQHRVWVTATRAERTSDTIDWHPPLGVGIVFPTTVERVQAAVADLTTAVTALQATLRRLPPTERAELTANIDALEAIATQLLPQPAPPVQPAPAARAPLGPPPGLPHPPTGQPRAAAAPLEQAPAMQCGPPAVQRGLPAVQRGPPAGQRPATPTTTPAEPVAAAPRIPPADNQRVPAAQPARLPGGSEADNQRVPPAPPAPLAAITAPKRRRRRDAQHPALQQQMPRQAPPPPRQQAARYSVAQDSLHNLQPQANAAARQRSKKVRFADPEQPTKTSRRRARRAALSARRLQDEALMTAQIERDDDSAMKQYYAHAAANLDESGKPLTFRQAMKGPDRAQWEQAQ